MSMLLGLVEITQERYVDAARSAVNTEKGYPKKLADSDNSLIGFGATYEINDNASIFFGFHEGFTPTSGGADPEEADNMEMGIDILITLLLLSLFTLILIIKICLEVVLHLVEQLVNVK